MRARAGVACGHTDGHMHNCEYVRWRASLVPVAEAEADARYPEPVDATLEQKWKWERKWDAAFHRAMERLVHDPFMKARFVNQEIYS